MMKRRDSDDYDNSSDEAWVCCISFAICIMLLLMLAFTASYPLTYYYNHHYYYQSAATTGVHGCPECWL